MATDFRVEWRGQVIHIARWSNHMSLLDGWTVCSWRGRAYSSDVTNPLYLNKDQVWRYKQGSTWTTPQEAMAFLLEWACPPGTNGWQQRAEDKMAPARGA